MKHPLSAITAMVLLLLCATGCSQKLRGSGSLEISGGSAFAGVDANGGECTLEVSWTNSRWKISESEESDIVESFMPVYGGRESGSGIAVVNLVVKANPASSGRRAEILLQDLSGKTSSTFLLEQEGAVTSGGDEGGSADTVKVLVDTGNAAQTIDGFGAMNNWGDSQYWSLAECDKLLGALGLDIMRVRISPNKNNWKNLLECCRYAVEKYGTKILASPWTMPVAWKDPQQAEAFKNNVRSCLKPEFYAEYAEYLEDFAKFMKEGGAPVYAVSMQNEPDWDASYEGCIWTSSAMRDFLRDYGQLVSSALLVSGESLNMNQSFYTESLEDEKSCANVDIVAGHVYGSGIKRFALAEEKGKPIWMTEHLLNESWSKNTDHWAETMTMALEINACMKAGWNAYVWWYGKRYYSFIGDGEQGSADREILKRGHAFGQFSKFVEPGCKRVQASSDNPKLDVSAYSGKDKTVAVLLNTGAETEASVDFGISADGAKAVCTSATLSSGDIPVSVSGDVVTLTLPPSSITTVIL